MSFASVIGIALVVGVVAIVGVAIVSYMSSLVRNAYEIKVEMRKDLDDGIKQVKLETIKQTKSARNELASEIEKSRAGMLEDMKRRQTATEAALAEELKKRDIAHKEEVENLHTIIQDLKDQMAAQKPHKPEHPQKKKPDDVTNNLPATLEDVAAPPPATEAPQLPPGQNLELTAFEGVTPIRKL